MTTQDVRNALGADGLLKFEALQNDAVSAVCARFFKAHGDSYARFGPRGREACREDLAFHLEFLRPVLEFGILQPMVDYLSWVGGVLSARGIPGDHLPLSLDWLGEFFIEEMPAGEGALVAEALKAAQGQFLASTYDIALPAFASAEPWPDLPAFEAALLGGRQLEAMAIANRCLDDGHSLVDVEHHLILPSLYVMGEKWQANKVTVAQQHIAAAIVQSVMTAGLMRSEPPPANGKRVLLACVEGNNHVIGLRMVSDGFQLAGWDVRFLGANMPTMSLIGQIVEWRPDLVGLSVSFPHQLRAVKQIIAQLVKRCGPTRPAVMIGGLAINRFPQLAGVVGADWHRPDAPSAIAYANEALAG